jgi:ATP-dependent protease ClpP protease subunit
MAKKIVIDGVIGWDITGRMIRGKLDAANGEDIEVEISSGGGFVFSGLEIFNLLKNYEGKVTTHLMGLAASMASYIALAGDYIKQEKNAIFMIHNAWSFAIGDQNDMRKEADILEGISNVLAKEYSKKSGKSFKEIKQMMDDETFLFGDEVLEAGFADEIIDSDIDDDKNDSIAKAKMTIENVLSTLRESEKAKSDLQKAAAWIQEKNLTDLTPENTIQSQEDSELDEAETQKNNPESSIKNNEERKSYMTREEFKAQHAELYNDVFNDGIKAGIEKENKRCLSFVEAMNTLPTGKEIYIDAIKNNKDVNDASVHAAIMAKIEAKNETKNAEEENPEDTNPDAPESDKNEDEEVKALTEKVMNKSRYKEGGKING